MNMPLSTTGSISTPGFRGRRTIFSVITESSLISLAPLCPPRIAHRFTIFLCSLDVEIITNSQRSVQKLPSWATNYSKRRSPPSPPTLSSVTYQSSKYYFPCYQWFIFVLRLLFPGTGLILLLPPCHHEIHINHRSHHKGQTWSFGKVALKNQRDRRQTTGTGISDPTKEDRKRDLGTTVYDWRRHQALLLPQCGIHMSLMKI